MVVALPRALLATTLGNDGRSLYAELPPALPTERLFIHLPQVNVSERVTVYRHVADPGAEVAASRAAAAARTRALGRGRPARRLSRDAERHPKWKARRSRSACRPTGCGSTSRGRIPAALPVVEAEWRPARIAFAARAPGPYRLAVGHEDAPASPSLDLRALLPADDAVRPQAAGRAHRTAGARVASGGADTARAARIAAQAHWSRVLLWSVLAIAVVGLAWMAWRLAAQLRTPSTAPRADTLR